MSNYINTSYQKYDRNSIPNINKNLSFEIYSNFSQSNEPGPYPTIRPESVKFYKNTKVKDNNYNTTGINLYNKDYYYEDYYQMNTYQPKNYVLTENYNNNSFQNNWNIRQHSLSSQWMDNKKRNRFNLENKGYPSNHSYYESKYTKKEKSENKNLYNINIYKNNPKINYININLNFSKNGIKNVNSNTNSLSLNSNKGYIITKNINKRYEQNITISLSNKKINEKSYEIPKGKINPMKFPLEQKSNVHSPKAPDNIKENQTFILYNNYNNNTYIKKIPRTPSVNSNNKINFPPKNIEERNINGNYSHEFLNEKDYNKTERNLSPKDFDEISFKNLAISQPNYKNEIKYIKNLGLSNNNRSNNNQQNINNLFRPTINIDKKSNITPKQMKITKIYANLNKDRINNNNNTTMSVKGNNENKGKNYIRNINIQEITKPINLKENEHIKYNRGIIPNEDKNKKKEYKILPNLKKKKKTTSQRTKLLESNNIKKLAGQNNNISKNKTTVVLFKYKKIQINDENSNNIKITKKPKMKSYEEENNYKKEIEKITYDNYSEPRPPIKYDNYEENNYLISYNNNKINNKKININGLSKGKEISSHKSLGLKKNNNNNEDLDLTQKINSKNKSINNQKPLKIADSSNIEHDILVKSKDKVSDIISNTKVNPKKNNKIDNIKSININKNASIDNYNSKSIKSNKNANIDKKGIKKTNLNNNFELEKKIENAIANISEAKQKTVPNKSKNNLKNKNSDVCGLKKPIDKEKKEEEKNKKEKIECDVAFKKIEKIFQLDDKINEPYDRDKNVEEVITRNITVKKAKQKYRIQELYPKDQNKSKDNKKSELENDKSGDEWDNIEYKGMRKKTFDIRKHSNKKGIKSKINSLLDNEFSSILYIRSTEALTIAGKNEFGQKKTNQDTYIMEKNVNGILNFNIFGVLDGHGDNGHFASQFVSRYVINKIKNHPSIKNLDEPKEIYNQLISNGYKIIANICLDVDSQIQKEKFDVSRSGTTLVLVIQLEEHIICANIGDSRAIVIFDENHKDNLANSKIYPLSYDCKPELPKEKKRILACGGVVEKAYYSDDSDDEYLPYRVWAKGKDYPGLAMSRSIGDTEAKKVGVIANPQIIEYTIDYFSKYLLMCSDGIWEFISNEDAMNIGNKYYLANDPMGLCHELSRKSIELWKEKDVVIDDITTLVIFF